MRRRDSLFPPFPAPLSTILEAVEVPDDPLPQIDPPLEPRDEAVFLLQVASEIEHALMVQYLYAAYSLESSNAKAKGWQDALLAIAKEEMGHLLTVQNILLAIGGPVSLERDEYPFLSRLYPIPFELKRVSRETLGFYVLAEMPSRTVLTPAENVTVSQIIQELNLPPGRVVNRVGRVYNRVLEVVGSLQSDDFVTEAAEFQADGAQWLAGDFGSFNLLIPRVSNRDQALAALRAIGIQGEGELSGTESRTHFDRFLAIYREFIAEAAPAVRPVPDNPNVPSLRENEDASSITDPEARRWAQLANLRYRMLLQFLSHYLRAKQGEDPAGRDLLRTWTFDEMRTLGALARKLGTLPQKPGGGPGRAAPPFEYPFSLVPPVGDPQRWRWHLDVALAAQRLIGQINSPELAALQTRTQAQIDALQQRAGTIREIKEIRLLPPLAIGRMGSSPDPMDAYDVQLPDDVVGYRKLVPAETLRVDTATGRISSAATPAQVRFRDANGRIRPVAPFFEVWARFTDSGPLVPLTERHLRMLGLSPASVRWTVRAGNMKAFRRTGAAGDRITATASNFSDHGLKALNGAAANFIAGRTIPFGNVQYIQPTADFPEIRLRYTPGPGRVYGPTQAFPGMGVVYNGPTGPWDNHNDSQPPQNSPTARARRSTIPVFIYARRRTPPTSNRSLGYLDDSCDGIIDVQLEHQGRTHRSSARFSSGPPDFAPDSFHMRSLADDLAQMALGPDNVAFATEAELADSVTDFMRRAMETMRLLDPNNLNQIFQVFPNAQTVRYGPVLQIHQGVVRSLAGLKRAAGTPERAAAVQALRQMAGILRPFNRTFDSSPENRRRMPVLMRGADGEDLIMGRRQLALVNKAIEVFSAGGGGGGGGGVGTPASRMLTMISALSGFSSLHGGVATPTGPLSARFGQPQQVLDFLTTANAQTQRAQAVGVQGQPLVVPGQPEASAFFRMINTPGHIMSSQIAGYTADGRTGVQIVREWILSLPS